MWLRADEQFGRKDGWGRNVGFGSQLSTRLNDDQLGAGAEVLLHLPSQCLQGGPSGISPHKVTSSSTLGARGRKGRGGRTLPGENPETAVSLLCNVSEDILFRSS